MRNFFVHFITDKKRRLIPNGWDLIALSIAFTFLVLLGTAAHEMTLPYHLGEPIRISLSPRHLPDYALQTILRMFIALFFSLLFTFTVGTLAAKNKYAGKILIPIIDILQSVPVMGFLTITVVGFISLFPGSLWGPECAAIFAIFTSQVWNMALSFYQSLITVPAELTEAADMFHLSAWQRFWRVEVPFAMPGLLWNTMLSMSASWFFVVASEAVTVSNQTITLPGIGSYIALAIEHKNIGAIADTVITMLIVILLYDQLLFRPLVKWGERFKTEQTTQQKMPKSWVAKIMQRTYLVKYIGQFLAYVSDKIINWSWLNQYRAHHPSHKEVVLPHWVSKVCVVLWYTIVTFMVCWAVYVLTHFITASVKMPEVKHVFWLGFLTALRVFSIVIISSIVWVPIGVWIGLKARVAQTVQPIVQFLAAFPVNLLFPFCVLAIVRYHLNVNIWTTPLMLLGTQWYVLFNVIAGASALPKDLNQVADNFGLKGWLWWKRLILPGIFPYYVTGALTAVGNAWNTSTVAEMVSWGSTTLHAKGLGNFIMEYSAQGNFPYLVLGICVMSVFVLTLNRILWRPLYKLAHTRYQLD